MSWSWPGSKSCGSVTGRDSVWRHGAGHDNCLLLFVLKICNARAHLSILRRPHPAALVLYLGYRCSLRSRITIQTRINHWKSLSFVFCSKPELLKLGTRMTYYLPPCVWLVLLRIRDILSVTIALSTNQQIDNALLRCLLKLVGGMLFYSLCSPFFLLAP